MLMQKVMDLRVAYNIMFLCTVTLCVMHEQMKVWVQLDARVQGFAG